ncbi:MAG: CpsD/CapB family tyrosine-protein kinase, partial [Olsenella profusa]
MPFAPASSGRATKSMDRMMQSVLNASKTLLANIRFMSVDHPIKTVVITSSVPNEGKTFIASNLASAIATSGRSVLLVECDMRRRSLAAVLDVHVRRGIYAVLSGQVPLRQAVIGTKTKNLHFLDAEPHIPNPSDLLGSKHFAALLQQMEQTYDYVIFDTPPVDAFVDAAVL